MGVGYSKCSWCISSILVGKAVYIGINEKGGVVYSKTLSDIARELIKGVLLEEGINNAYTLTQKIMDDLVRWQKAKAKEGSEKGVTKSERRDLYLSEYLREVMILRQGK